VYDARTYPSIKAKALSLFIVLRICIPHGRDRADGVHLGLPPASEARAVARRTCTVPTQDLVISESTLLCPGTYPLPDSGLRER